jgi:hypothetical protein
MRGVFLALLLSAAPCGAAEPILGFSFPVWWHDAYASPRSAESLARMKEMGAGWVVIIPTLFVKDRADSEVRATDATASDDTLRLAVRRAHALGLKVLFKPHVDMPGGAPRALLSPSDRARWFSTYGAHLSRYARLAAEEKCEMFSVGTELSLLTLPPDTRSWRALIAETRRLYPGPLTYAANWHSIAHVGFWRELDYIGVDGYFPVPGGSNRAALEAGWRPWVLGLAALSKLHGKPVLFTEVGLAAQKGANLRPWDWHDYAPLDLEVQAAYMDAFLAAFSSQPWFRGFLYWAWEADLSRTGPNDQSMSVQGKPAEAVLRRAFADAKSPPPLPRNWRERLEDLSRRLVGVHWP